MEDQKKRWARLLPDYRTMYLSLEEMEAHRQHAETDADLVVRSLRYAHRVAEDDPGLRKAAAGLVRRAGVPDDDELGLQLAMALVVRGRFLSDHPHLAALQDSADESNELPMA